MSKLADGAPLLVAATVVAGVSTYFATVLVYRDLGAATYITFAAFWAVFFLTLGSLSGLQQEFTRASRELPLGVKPRTVGTRIYSSSLAIFVSIIIIVTSGVWGEATFGSRWDELIWPFAIGCASYILLSPLAGVLSGLSKWKASALVVSLDGLLRMTSLFTALIFTDDMVVLAWCVSASYPIVVALMWPFIRKGVARRSFLDVNLFQLSLNLSRTLVASGSMSLLVSGFPLFIIWAARGEVTEFLAELIFSVTLIRAPIVVLAISMHAFLVVKFRDRTGERTKLLLKLLTLVILGTVLLALIGYFTGPSVIELVTGEKTQMTPEYVAAIILSSGLMAGMIVSASSLLAQGRHILYSSGWLVAVAATILVIVSEGELGLMVLLAMVVGPALGLLALTLPQFRKSTAPSDSL
jgi:O-antigen/teichoic acid export membrane protein